MRPVILTACFLLLTGCTAAPSPTAPVGSTAPSPPSATPSLFVWEEFHSDDLIFSLQLPRGWTARRTGPDEDIVLRAEGGADGDMVMTVEMLENVDAPFQEIVNDFFGSIIAEDPNAVEPMQLEGGTAARATSPRENGGVSVIYLFAPQGNHAKTIAFTWDHAEPNPIWHGIAERFNAYAVQPIIPFESPPAPASPSP